MGNGKNCIVLYDCMIVGFGFVIVRCVRCVMCVICEMVRCVCARCVV